MKLADRILAVHEPRGLAHPPSEHPRLPWWIAAAAVIAAGAALMLLGAGGDLWLDEILSLELARGASSAIAIFTSIHLDNNHHLNALYLRAIGHGASPVVYRLLAILTGTGTLAVAVLSQARRARVTAMTWLVLLAASSFLIHYSSEARGYAPAILCAVACHAAMKRLLESRRTRWALTFAAMATLGILSHLTFLYALAAFLAWAMVEAIGRQAVRDIAPALVTAFAPPLAGLAALWVVDLRYLVMGGGPDYRLFTVLRELLRRAMNVPAGPAELFVLAVLAAAALEVVRLARDRDTEWVFHAVILLAGPGAFLLLTRPAYLAPRYFAVSVPFLLLLVARFLARAIRSGRGGSYLAMSILVLFLAGGAPYLTRLFTDGRGRYQETIRFIATNTPGPVATVGSDNDFRNNIVFTYHYRELRVQPPITYIATDRWRSDAPLWVLRELFAEDPVPEAAFRGPNGLRYNLARVFPYAGLSGWDWYVYRMAEQPPL